MIFFAQSLFSIFLLPWLTVGPLHLYSFYKRELGFYLLECWGMMPKLLEGMTRRGHLLEDEGFQKDQYIAFP